MARKKAHLNGHTGLSPAGHTRDGKVERVGKVTIYKRGAVYYLYYRQGGASQRRRVDGNLAVARATASKVLAALDEGKPSPVAYTRTGPDQMVEGFLDAVANVKRLALRTRHPHSKGRAHCRPRAPSTLLGPRRRWTRKKG